MKRITIPAAEVQHGDVLPGGLKVYAISHGPLDNQLRFRDYSETQVAFRAVTELVTVEREERS